MSHGMLLMGLALSLGAPTLKEPPKKEPPSIVGKWDVETVVVGGRTIRLPGESMEFSKENKLITRSAQGTTDNTEDYKLDVGKPIAEIDWSIKGGQLGPTLKGIYKIEGDTLTICTNKDLNGPRPTSFESAVGSTIILWTLKRAEKKD